MKKWRSGKLGNNARWSAQQMKEVSGLLEQRNREKRNWTEFQQRGSPHVHWFLWLKDAPKYDEDDEESVRQCIQFIDSFISCRKIDTNPYIGRQTHAHTHTCTKTKGKYRKQCRFNFPLLMMPETVILHPLDPEERTKDEQDNFTRIKEKMKAKASKMCSTIWACTFSVHFGGAFFFNQQTWGVSETRQLRS